MADGALPNLSEIEIKSQTGSYKVLIQDTNLLHTNNCFYLIDSKVDIGIEISTERVVYLDVEEKEKNLAKVEEVILSLSSLGMTRKNQLVVIGGGFSQDIGTLVASLYMRGVEWVFLPTTLAAMGDSCVGGKSSINSGDVKNLVGNFYPPTQIEIDVRFVDSLPLIEKIAGFSEILKICFAHSPNNFQKLLELIDFSQIKTRIDNLTGVIRLSIESKKYFIEEDEFDTGIRKKLNFGHSFGHALESATDYRIPHGVAVLLGMLAACNHPAAATNPETEMLCSTSLNLLRQVRNEIQPALMEVNFEKFRSSISKDKKNSERDLILILPGTDGLEIVSLSFEDDSVSQATNSMKEIIERFLNEVR
jgi:3-dehydroquinate synthase